MDLIHYNYIEGLVDSYILLHRPETFKKNPSPEEMGITELIIAKNKIGSQSIVKLAFIKDIPVFENLSIYNEEELDIDLIDLEDVENKPDS